MTDRLTILQGDCLERLREVPDESVHMCVTSSPYWGLRSYLSEGHVLKGLELGSEKTPDEYVARMVDVFREVRRVLREDGTCWINLGDCYGRSGGAPGGGNRELMHLEGKQRRMLAIPQNSYGLKPKDLVGIPWRVAFALQADGWWLRSDIIWHKPNPMPESVTDRPTKAHEYLFLLAKAASYYYDAEAVKEEQTGGTHERYAKNNRIPHKHKQAEPGSGIKSNTSFNWAMQEAILPGGRNKRTVWTVPSAPYSEAHFATYPPDLIKPCILAGTSARGCCPKCGAGWERVVENSPMEIDRSNRTHEMGRTRSSGTMTKPSESKTTGWRPTCSCGETQTVPCTVLDPFAGSGTTGQVALELGRRAILIELNPDYVKLIEHRTHITPGLALG